MLHLLPRNHNKRALTTQDVETAAVAVSSDSSSVPDACCRPRRRRRTKGAAAGGGGAEPAVVDVTCVCKRALCVPVFEPATVLSASPGDDVSVRAGVEEYWKICFGSMYIMRRREGEECHVDFRNDIITPLCGRDPSALAVTPHVALAGEDCDFVKNVRVLIHFSTCNGVAVWPELHRKVATFRAQPWMANTLFSVFGNIYYRMDSKTLDCTALRDLRHVQVLAHIVRDEAKFGGFESVEVLNFNLMRTLDRYVQVTVGGLLERVLTMCFRDIVYVVPRTEEMSGVFYLVLSNVSAFIQQGQILTGKPAPSTELQRCLAVACMSHCRANLHITYSGKVTINFAWRCSHPRCSPSELQTLQQDIQAVAGHLRCVIQQLC